MDRNMQVPLEQKMIDLKSRDQFADRDRTELYGDLNKLPQSADATNHQKLVDNGILPNLCLSDFNPFDKFADSSRTLNNAQHSPEMNKRLDDAQKDMHANASLNSERNPDRRPVTETPKRTPEQAEQSANKERSELTMELTLDPSRRTKRAEQTFDPNVWITE